MGEWEKMGVQRSTGAEFFGMMTIRMIDTMRNLHLSLKNTLLIYQYVFGFKELKPVRPIEIKSVRRSFCLDSLSSTERMREVGEMGRVVRRERLED